MALAVSRERSGPRVELVANGVYGTILAAATMSVLSEKVYDEPLKLSGEVVGTLVVFWLAHTFALGLAHRAVGDDPDADSAYEQLMITWPMVAAGFPLLVPLFLAHVGVFSVNAALWISYILAIAILASWGLAIGRRRGQGALGTVWLMAASGALGVLLIALKELVH
jgi:nitrate reductase gamma subunit